MTTVELPVPAVPVPRQVPAAPVPRRPWPLAAAPRRPEHTGAIVAQAVPIRLVVPGRTLVLVAGMPGAGKSTLIAGLRGRAGTVVLDSDDHRVALARRFPRLPYRRYRGLVHLRHRLAAGRAAFSNAPTVVLHLPATSCVLRAAVALLAALTGRAAHLLWLHVDPDEAVAGQRERGRLVPPGSFAGHARRAAATGAALRAGRAPGWTTVTVAGRAAARAGLVLDTPSSR